MPVAQPSEQLSAADARKRPPQQDPDDSSREEYRAQARMLRAVARLRNTIPRRLETTIATAPHGRRLVASRATTPTLVGRRRVLSDASSVPSHRPRSARSVVVTSTVERAVDRRHVEITSAENRHPRTRCDHAHAAVLDDEMNVREGTRRRVQSDAETCADRR